MPTQDPRIRALPAAAIRQRFLEFFAARGHTVVPSASLVPGGDQTLLFTNAGMVQFKDVFTGAEKRSYKRAVDAQRVLRVAGKHNDFEEVGRTPRHHTLFEMLGNWSFGDYFKREAIHWAWELLTEDYGIPAERLAATTYSTDTVAWDIWREEIGLPADRMARWGDIESGDEHNFWRMAETGACGPCSEIHFDRGAELSEGPHCIPDHSEHCPRWLEIWNLVFMEFEQLADGQRVPLPFTSVDTGMGLERLASVLQQVPSNYDTDLFSPIHACMRQLVGHDPDAFEAERFSYQVIADHSRAITFLIADGVLPSNEGRGYVLRRILRRAVRHGRLLGRRGPFLAETARVVIETMAGAYPHLVEGRERILSTIGREETLFARTLESGTAQLETALLRLNDVDRVVGRRIEELGAEAPVLSGEVAFRLHDTFGFPIDLTLELAAEYGVSVDRAGFERALSEQRDRSRRGRRSELARTAELGSLYESVLLRGGPTEFLGYETTAAAGRVVAVIRDGLEYAELAAIEEMEGRAAGAAAAEVVVDRTPFYAEGGGQIGDRGMLASEEGGPAIFRVADTQRPVGGLIVHRGSLIGRIKAGAVVWASVDADRRARTMRNHTATHLLHRALRNVVGPAARQAGSLVAPEGLRFDYPFERPLTGEERTAIETEVRRIIREDRPVSASYSTMAEALAAGADAFFDEKYGEQVRTIGVADYSLELCGGTHCRATGQIGSFLITSDRSIGTGMRRIEALTGEGADAHVAARLAVLDRLTKDLGAVSVEALPDRIAALQTELREAKQRLREAADGHGTIPRPGELGDLVRDINGLRILTFIGPFESIDRMKGYAKDIRAAVGPNVLALGGDADPPGLFLMADAAAVGRGIDAGDLVRGAAPLIEARGGGRPEMAQAQGTRREGVREAIAAIEREVLDRLGMGP